MKQMMRISDRGIALVKEFEGFRAEPYRCAGGKLTIGYGHTGRGVSEFEGPLSLPEAGVLLRLDLQRVELELAGMVGVSLRQGQVDALVSLGFNVGCGALRRSTLVRKLNLNPEDPTIADEFRRWIYAAGVPLEGLRRRREAEVGLWNGA